MNRVLDRLWIGSSADLEPRVPLKSLGFSAVVDLRDGSTVTPRTDDLALCRLVNRDGDAWTSADVEATFRFIDAQIRHGKVLVACAAGMSRSACIVIGYLVKSGWSLPEAYQHVRDARPRIAPVTSMLESVLAVTR